MGKPKADKPETTIKQTGAVTKHRKSAPWKKAKSPERVTMVKEVFGKAKEPADAAKASEPVDSSMVQTALPGQSAATADSSDLSVEPPSGRRVTIQGFDGTDASQDEEDDANEGDDEDFDSINSNISENSDSSSAPHGNE